MIIRRIIPQPLIAFLISGFALLAFLAAWRMLPLFDPSSWVTLVALALGLGLAAVLADLRPIHIHYHTKVTVTTVPLYMLAVLLPPPLAALAAGGSRLLGELLERKKCGNLPSDIATSTARWALIGLVTSAVAHTPGDHLAARFVALVAAAGVMYLSDLLTSVLEIAPITGEPPHHVLLAVARESGRVEALQYVVAVVGGMAALESVWTLGTLLAPMALLYGAFKHARELHHSTGQMLEAMADAVDLRDPYTGGHSRRVTELCAEILRAMGLTGPDTQLIISAARVHDIGKIGIPDGILNKPGSLTAEERAIMEAHAARGADLLARNPNFAHGVAIVRHHHERWDGKGYPDGKAGYDIPFGARVMAVADSFDAMTSDRPYRAGMTVERAVGILRDGRGTQWDAEIVDVFLRIMAGHATPTPAAEPPRAGVAVAS